MAQCGLDTTGCHPHPLTPRAEHGGRKGANLNRIAERRARAVHLREPGRPRSQRRVGQCGHEKALLRPAVRRGEAGRFAVLLDRTPVEDGRCDGRRAGRCDGRRIRSVGYRLHHQAGACIGASVPVSTHIEGVRTASLGRHASQREVPTRGRRKHEHDARDQTHGTLFELKCTPRSVARDERRGASRVARDTRTMQTEHVREAARSDGEARACGRVCASRRPGRGEHLRKLCGSNAKEDASERALERGASQTGFVQCGVATLGQHAVLRVHRGGLDGRDVEGVVVEELLTVDEPALAHAPLNVWREPSRHSIMVPSHCRDLPNHVRATRSQVHERARVDRPAGE